MKNGLDKIQEIVTAMAGNAGENGPSLIVAAAISVFRFGLNRDVVKSFFTKTTPEGDVWAPRKDNKPHPLLILSGDMLEAAINSCQGGTETGTGVVIPLEGPSYRLIHQLGKGRIPRRRFFGITEKTEYDVKDVIEKTTVSTTNLFNAAANAAR